MKEEMGTENQKQLPMADIAPQNVEQRSRRRPPPRSGKRANELDGRTWERNSISVWSDIRKTPEEVKLRHPALFPLELVVRLIQCFTNRYDKIILDPFAGVGSTPIAAELMGKTGIGIELSPELNFRSSNEAVAARSHGTTSIMKKASTGRPNCLSSAFH